jgi:hypothetical protein
MDATIDPELIAAAEEELKAALRLTWKQLSGLIPWGDTFEGFGPDGGALMFERAYIWRDVPGGDILCEVTAYRGPSRYDRGAKASAVIERP